jgi:ADP-ribosylglycohydrolase
MGERADLSLNRRRGALLGLAVGDALGAAVEFMSPGSFEPVSDYRDGGAHGLAPGEWTDDTSMALALADSIAERGWDLHHQAERYLAWWKTGAYSVTGRAFDIGVTTAASLRRFAATRDARTSGADTTGAVCGQFAGAYFGESGIPQEWRDRLGGRAIIDPILTRLLLRAP